MSVELNSTFNYHDFKAMKSLNQATRDQSDKNIEVVAKQMESVFLQMVVKSMRDANKAFESDMFSGQSTDFYNDMYDQQITLSLSQGEGIGLAKVIASQLKMSQAKQAYEQTGDKT